MSETKRLKPVENWRDGWKWISVWMMGVPSSALGFWTVAPQQWRDAVPAQWLLYLFGVCGVVGLVGRFINQAALMGRGGGDEQPGEGE